MAEFHLHEVIASYLADVTAYYRIMIGKGTNPQVA